MKKGFSIKKQLSILCMLLAGAVGCLAADSVDSDDSVDTATPATLAAGATPAPPQLFLNLAGIGGVLTEPAVFNGQGLGGAEAGLEYISQYVPDLGVDVDYDYLAVGKATNERDNDLDLSLRLIAPGWGPIWMSMQAGVGANLTANPINGHWLCFAEPGLRWVLFPRLAIDAGVRYIVTSPSKAYVQAWTGTIGISIPLDGDYATECAPPQPKPVL
jgi:hypothetical protein